jgi:hypothetical protein
MAIAVAVSTGGHNTVSGHTGLGQGTHEEVRLEVIEGVVQSQLACEIALFSLIISQGLVNKQTFESPEVWSSLTCLYSSSLSCMSPASRKSHACKSAIAPSKKAATYLGAGEREIAWKAAMAPWRSGLLTARAMPWPRPLSLAYKIVRRRHWDVGTGTDVGSRASAAEKTVSRPCIPRLAASNTSFASAAISCRARRSPFALWRSNMSGPPSCGHVSLVSSHSRYCRGAPVSRPPRPRRSFPRPPLASAFESADLQP